MIPFIQVHWLAILFLEYFVLVCIIFNMVIGGDIEDISQFKLTHIKYFLLFFFALPLIIFEILKQIVIRKFTDG